MTRENTNRSGQNRETPNSNIEIQQVDRSYSYGWILFFFGKQKLRARLSLEVHGGPLLQIFHPQSETSLLRPRHSWSIDVALSSTGAELGLDMLLISVQSYAPTEY